LEKKGIIKKDKTDKKISFLEHSFYYDGDDLAALTADIIGIWGNDFDYFHDRLVSTEIYSFEGPYESGSVVIKENDHVIDAGANIGIFSVLASKKVGHGGKIYSFEPIMRTRKLLEKNVAANDLRNIAIKSVALGDKNGSALFNIPADLGGSSFVFSSEQIHSRESELTEMRTLDSLVESGEIPRVDFVKADIEGSERNLLAGARETIRRFHPRLSLCIYHRPDDKEVLTELLLDIEPKYRVSYSPTKMFAYYNESE